MEDLNDKGLFLDELQKLRVIEPDAAEQVALKKQFTAVPHFMKLGKWTTKVRYTSCPNVNIVKQAKDLKDECGGLLTQTEDFRRMTDQFIALTEQVRTYRRNYIPIGKITT